MMREHVIEKILREMHQRRMYDVSQESWVRGYLEMVYGAGFDEGRLLTSHRKRVCKLDETGRVLATYESVKVAARLHKLKPPNVYAVIAGDQRSAGGFFWRYETQIKNGKNESKKRKTTQGSGNRKTRRGKK